MEFPDDESGDTLRRMVKAGDDLAQPREIDFTVIFPDENAANAFANRVRTDGFVASVEMTGSNESLPWDVVVTKFMVPCHETITALEDQFENAASQFGGRNDGWGCLSVNP